MLCHCKIDSIFILFRNTIEKAKESSDSFINSLQTSCSKETILISTAIFLLTFAFLAGLTMGFWKSEEELAKLWKCDVLFRPRMNVKKREDLYRGWKKAVKRVLSK